MSMILFLILVIFLSFIICLWSISHRFRYIIKMVTYVGCIFITGLIAWPYCAVFGRSAENHQRFFRVFHLLTSWVHIEFRKRNLENLDNAGKPCIIIANHQSSLDMMSMGAMWPKNCVALIKSSLKYLPGGNLCCYLSKDVWVNRFSKENAHRSLDKAVEVIQEDQSKIFVFPEGTRNHNEGLLPFKKGAFILAKRAKIPIVPVIFSSYKPFYDKNSSKFHLNGHVIIEALPAIDSEQFDTVEQLADECRSRMLEAFGQISKEAEEWSSDLSKLKEE